MLKDGGSGSWGGSLRAAVEIADCTSRAAPSMLRSSENCNTICVAPIEELDVIEEMPEIAGLVTDGIAMIGLMAGSDDPLEIDLAKFAVNGLLGECPGDRRGG